MPKQFLAGGDTVVVIGEDTATAIPTGKNYSTHWIQMFTLKDQKITQGRAFIDTLQIAKASRDRGGTFLAISLISFFVFHILINVSMQIGILPTTGIPLPLISYGGSSTLMFFMAIGLMANVDMRRFVNA